MMMIDSEKTAAIKALQRLIHNSRADNYEKRNGLHQLLNFCKGDLPKTVYQSNAHTARDALNRLGEKNPDERLVFEYIDGTVLFYENMANVTLL